MEDKNGNGSDKIYSQKVKAGKRTYFFDVRATRNSDYYLVLTESRKRFQGEEAIFEKNRIFLYKEDFAKFLDALQATIEHVKTDLMPDYDYLAYDRRKQEEEGFDSDLKWD